jgi:hypothetical protein
MCCCCLCRLAQKGKLGDIRDDWEDWQLDALLEQVKGKAQAAQLQQRAGAVTPSNGGSRLRRARAEADDAADSQAEEPRRVSALHECMSQHSCCHRLLGSSVLMQSIDLHTIENAQGSLYLLSGCTLTWLSYMTAWGLSTLFWGLHVALVICEGSQGLR